MCVWSCWWLSSWPAWPTLDSWKLSLHSNQMSVKENNREGETGWSKLLSSKLRKWHFHSKAFFTSALARQEEENVFRISNKVPYPFIAGSGFSLPCILLDVSDDITWWLWLCSASPQWSWRLFSSCSCLLFSIRGSYTTQLWETFVSTQIVPKCVGSVES